ncbi:MAG: hypothetical protein HZA93_02265 [Verrucomicrobia bacterium]|nr:hypothetical protein [Verrucomicrobiota bacterium]
MAIVLIFPALHAAELPSSFHDELRKVADPAVRAKLETAIVVWMRNAPGDRVAAFNTIMNCEQEDLVLFLCTKDVIVLGESFAPERNLWANRSLRLLTRTMLYVNENNRDPGVGPKAFELYFGRLSQLLLKLMRDNGVTARHEESFVIYGPWEPAKAHAWLEAKLRRALRESPPASQFHRDIEECLQLVSARRDLRQPGNSARSTGRQPLASAPSTHTQPRSAASSTPPTHSSTERSTRTSESFPWGIVWWVWAGGITVLVISVVFVVRRFR